MFREPHYLLLLLGALSGCFRDPPRSGEPAEDAGAEADARSAPTDAGPTEATDAAEPPSDDAAEPPSDDAAQPPEDAGNTLDGGTFAGCVRDAECGREAVCIEADATCVGDADVVFITEWGNDAGSCSRSEPCASIPFALAQAGERKVVKVLGGSLSASNVTIKDQKGLIFDGDDTAINTNGHPTLVLQGQASATFEGFRFLTPQTLLEGTANITVNDQAKAHFYDVRFGGDGGLALLLTFQGEVTMNRVQVGALTTSQRTELRCQDGSMTIENSVLEHTRVGGDGGSCHLTVSRNRFESPHDGSVVTRGGVLVMENNLVIHRDGYNDSASVSDMYPGSTIRFNTFINTTALPSDGAALYCDRSVVVTSNVFAYNSEHPLTGVGCETRYSVFDDRAQNSAGVGNRVADIESLFVDRSGGDYHLAPGSKARGAAEPDLDMVSLDLEGNPRPRPAGTRADSGAFEVAEVESARGQTP